MRLVCAGFHREPPGPVDNPPLRGVLAGRRRARVTASGHDHQPPPAAPARAGPGAGMISGRPTQLPTKKGFSRGVRCGKEVRYPVNILVDVAADANQPFLTQAGAKWASLRHRTMLGGSCLLRSAW